MQDKKYGDFHARLMPDIKRELIIGVRVPEIRKYAKSIYGTMEAEEFMSALPHRYYEENNLHAFIIQQIKDIDLLLQELEIFLPYIDNWATCDMLRPKVFSKHKEVLSGRISIWLKSEHTYTVRYAIGMLLSHFLDQDFDEKYLRAVCDIKSDEYYINMMRAWFFAEALAKQYEKAVPYIENRLLDDWTHRKAIQKAVESFRVSDEHKEYLKSFR